MLRVYLLLPILAATFPLLAKEGGPAISPSPINSPPKNPVSDLIQQLPSSELQEALAQLRSNYIDPAALKNPEIDETALESLVARFGPGAMIQTKEEVEQPLPFRPFKAELLYSQFVYIRLGGVTQNTLTQLDAALHDFRDAAGLVLDLRTVQQTSDYTLAAAIASRFVPKGQPIFKLVREAQEKPFVTNVDPLFSGPITVLV